MSFASRGDAKGSEEDGGDTGEISDTTESDESGVGCEAPVVVECLPSAAPDNRS